MHYTILNKSEQKTASKSDRKVVTEKLYGKQGFLTEVTEKYYGKGGFGLRISTYGFGRAHLRVRLGLLRMANVARLTATLYRKKVFFSALC